MYHTLTDIDGIWEVVAHKDYAAAMQYLADATVDGRECKVLQGVCDNSDALQRAA